MLPDSSTLMAHDTSAISRFPRLAIDRTSLAGILTALALLAPLPAAAQPAPGIPHLQRQGTATQLVVDGKPFLIRGGELGNSSASSLTWLAPHWKTFRDARLNTIVAPVYFPQFVEWTRRYARGGNPLFIPEALRSPEASANSLYAFAEHDAIGFSPFAIEGISGPAARLLAASNDVVDQLTPLIAAHQGRGTMAGLLQEHPDNRQPQQLVLNGYVLNASFERAAPASLAEGAVIDPAGASAAPTWPAGGLVIATGPDEFLFAGIGVTVTFATPQPGDQAGILSVEEGRVVNGAWENIRWLNGDQTHQGRHLRLEPGRFTIQRIRLYRYR